MRDKNAPKLTQQLNFKKIFYWAMLLLGITILISLVYKSIIDAKVFQAITRKKIPFRIIFCSFELILLLGYWYGVLNFAQKLRHRSHSMKMFYLRTIIIFIIFSVLYLGWYLLMSREVFLWVFRVTINLICFTGLTMAPENLVPYMLAYLAITFALMLSEPLLSKASHKIKRKFRNK